MKHHIKCYCDHVRHGDVYIGPGTDVFKTSETRKLQRRFGYRKSERFDTFFTIFVLVKNNTMQPEALGHNEHLNIHQRLTRKLSFSFAMTINQTNER